MSITASGIGFAGGGDGNLRAFDLKSGKVLWKFQTGRQIAAGPSIYSVNGKEYVAITIGGSPTSSNGGVLPGLHGLRASAATRPSSRRRTTCRRSAACRAQAPIPRRTAEFTPASLAAPQRAAERSNRSVADGIRPGADQGAARARRPPVEPEHVELAVRLRQGLPRQVAGRRRAAPRRRLHAARRDGAAGRLLVSGRHHRAGPARGPRHRRRPREDQRPQADDRRSRTR